MAEAITIARPYAEAAFKLAREGNKLAAWAEMLEMLEAIVQDERVALLIGDPKIDGSRLESLMLDLCGDRIDGTCRNLVQLLIANHRLSLVPEIRDIFEQLKREQEGLLEAQIYSAFPLNDAQVAPLVSKLEAKYQRKVRAAVSVDPELIGGVKIVIGDKVIDATVRGRLNAMSAALIR